MKFKKKVLDNGLTILHEKREVPVVTLTLACKYGGAYEDLDEKGISHFMEHMCFKGTEKRSFEDISFEIESVGGEFNAFTGEDVTCYHIKIPSKNLRIAAEILFDSYFNPVFPKEEIKKEANVILEEIKMRKDHSIIRASEGVKKLLYDSPFGEDIIGSEKVIKSMTREKLYKKHREFYTPQNTIFSVVGNCDFKDVLDLSKKFLIKRKGKIPKRPKIKKQMKNNFYEKRSDSSQVNVCFGTYFPNAEENSKYAAEVFSTILGEGMSSRLFKEVREKRGLVYGVRTHLDSGKGYGYIILWAGTSPSNLENVKKICLEEFEKMKEVSEKEISFAKKRLIGKMSVDIESSEDVSLQLVYEELYGDARDFYKYSKNINSVRLKDIKKLATKKKFVSYAVGP